MALKDVKNRISSVKNIQKITRAMEMVAAARLRRAEQRIEALRPYASAIRRMTRQAAEAAGTGELNNLPILRERETEQRVALLMVTADRVGEFHKGLVERMHAEIPETLKKLAGGDWSDETQKELDAAVAQYAQDFGYDLDEEGQPLTDEQAIREGGGRREEREEEPAAA